MADPDSLNKPHLRIPDLTSPVPPNPRKSNTNFLCKSLLVMFVLIILPLFPSQAPEIINQTIITKLWELLHLLFIGIAVSYGLFSRRNAQMKTEPHSSFDNSQNYLSGILHVSSIFEGGFQNPNGSDEKRMNQTWNSQYFQSESVFVSRENHALYQCGEIEPFIDYKPLGLPVRSLRSRNVDDDISESRNGSGSSLSSNGSLKSSHKIRKRGNVRGMAPINLEENFNETVTLPSPIPWRSRSGRMEMREEIANVKPPAHSRPLSVGNFELESLKSRSFQSSLASQSSSISSSPKKLSPSSSVSRELPNLEMENLERNESFYQSSKPGFVTNVKARGFSIGSSSEMNFQKSSEDNLRDFSRNKRDDLLGMREEIANVKPPSHSRPLSVGNFESESHKSRSFRSSLASQQCSISLSPKKLSPSSSVSQELTHLEMENLERNKSFYGSSKTGSLTNSKAQGFSVGSSLEMNFQKNSNSDLRDFTKTKRDDPLGRGKCGVDFLSSDAKPVTDVKSLYRGKSVRTIRSNEHLVENKKTGENFVNRIDEKDEKIHGKFEQVQMANTGQRAEIHFMNGEKQESDDSNIVESENDSESEVENFHVSSTEEDAESCFADESELECDEVDKKAGEFIAKFREQIRLQKTSSIRG